MTRSAGEPEFVAKTPTEVTRKAAVAAKSSLISSSETSNLTKPPRVTKRELKKQVDEAEDDDDDDDDDDNDGGDDEEETKAEFQSPVMKKEAVEPAFGSHTTPATPSSLHDDFIKLMKAQGLERMATDAGILKDGQFRDLKREWGESMSTSSFMSEGTPASSSFLGTSASAKKKKPRAAAGTPLSEKGSKGLRHFSMKVCQKVEEKHVTTYNEVADELVHEFVTMRPADSVYDEKNIRRRVYDALNVLMAMDIISKEKKEIRWRGLPSNAKQDLELLVAERNQRVKNIEQKKQQLQELLLQQIALKNLHLRNKQEKEKPAPLSRISLPFILVNTSKETVIQCEMSEDRQDIFFNFSGPFEINDDSEILKRMGLHRVEPDQVASYIPEKLIRYLPAEYQK
ncbi:hypothetical protein LEN26_005250 [Aphanomyces euteiches]|nr:hypothetical protein LEN26_005250 [Aphanomyces euteiches]